MPSTAIKSIIYDPAARRMLVTFVTGRRYIYENVPPDVHAAFQLAPSKGGFFNEEIRDRYAFHEVKRRA